MTVPTCTCAGHTHLVRWTCHEPYCPCTTPPSASTESPAANPITPKRRAQIERMISAIYVAVEEAVADDIAGALRDLLVALDAAETINGDLAEVLAAERAARQRVEAELQYTLHIEKAGLYVCEQCDQSRAQLQQAARERDAARALAVDLAERWHGEQHDGSIDICPFAVCAAARALLAQEKEQL